MINTKCRKSSFYYSFCLFLCLFTLVCKSTQITSVKAFSYFNNGEEHYTNISLMRSWLFAQNEMDIVSNTMEGWSRKRLFSDMLNFLLSQQDKKEKEKTGSTYISPLNFESTVSMGKYDFIYNTNIFKISGNNDLVISHDYGARNFFSTNLVDAEIRVKNYAMGFIVSNSYIKSSLDFVLQDQLDRAGSDLNEHKIKKESTGFGSQAYFFNDVKISNSFYLSGILMGGNSYPRSTFYKDLKLADTSRAFGYQLQLSYMRSGLLESKDVRLGLIGYFRGMYNYRVNNLNLDRSILEDSIERKYYVASMDIERTLVGGTVIVMMNNHFARGRMYFLVHASMSRLVRDFMEYKTGESEVVQYKLGIGIKDEPYLNALSIGIDIGLMTFANWDLTFRSTLNFGHGGARGSFGLGVKIII